ncbi:MAG: amphi-Trp domain-containing protein [Mesorhizobium sp.]
MTADRDVEKSFSLPEFVAELRRLADALEAGEGFEIEIDGEQVVVPLRATVSVEHEREDGHEEIEFQLSWAPDEDDDENDDEAEADEEEEDFTAA